MIGRDPALFEFRSHDFYPEALLPTPLDWDVDRLEKLLREIVLPLPPSLSQGTVNVKLELLSDIAATMSRILRQGDDIISLLNAFGYEPEGLMELVDQYQTVVVDKYEHDRDQRIVLAALVLHLSEGTPTQASKDAAVAAARMALGAFENEPPVIDEPVDEKYALRLIKSLDDSDEEA